MNGIVIVAGAVVIAIAAIEIARRRGNAAG
jgi:hypothetical protein